MDAKSKRNRGEQFVPRGGLLVPADLASNLDDKAAAERREQLTAARNLVAVEREDSLRRKAENALHEIAMSDVREQAAAAKRARKERAKNAQEIASLDAMYRKARVRGSALWAKAQLDGSAERRAMRLARARKVTLIVLLPALIACGVWSTAGAQAGAVRLADLKADSFGWHAAWAVEPVLITIVALIIIVRSILRSCGGDTDSRADNIERGALAMSLALNIVGGWHGGIEGILNALPHSIGPLGCAFIARLIGILDDYFTKANPWKDAKRLDEMGFAAQPQTPRDDAQPAPLTHLAGHDGYALDSAQDAQHDDPVTHEPDAPKPRNERSSGRRAKPDTQPPTSGYAPGEDPGTLAALDFLAGKYASKRQAADAHGVSEGTVRNRVAQISATGGYAPPDTALTQKPINGHPVLTGTGHDHKEN